MLKQFLNHIAHYQLCKTKDKILLAVSGGVDSMVMLHLFRKAGFSIGVAHCNFRLRGKDSDDDEEFVRRATEQALVPFHVGQFETEHYAEEKGISIQMAARELRYRFFEEVCEKLSYQVVATAHHLDDSLETVLLNLVRGTGISGLTGIPVKMGIVIRPMLFATRESIQRYAIENGIAWRDDVTNATDDYQRNFVRHHVVGRLKELNPNLPGTFAESLQKIQGARIIFDRAMEALKRTAVERQGDRFILTIEAFKNTGAANVTLWETLREFGFGFDQCVDMTRSTQAGKQFFSESHVLTVDRGVFVVEPRLRQLFPLTEIGPGAGTVEQGGVCLQLEVVDKRSFIIDPDPGVGQFDTDRITYPILWRSWKAGDAFVPLGMEQTKKVSDFLIDEKVSRPDKERTTVMESGGQIIWVVGRRISEPFKVTDNTRQVLVIRPIGK